MFLYCHNCNWEQDDFWDENYNPLRYLLSWEKDLLDFEKLDNEICYNNKTYREAIIESLYKVAEDIKDMKFLKYEEGKKYKCPKCDNYLYID